MSSSDRRSSRQRLSRAWSSRSLPGLRVARTTMAPLTLRGSFSAAQHLSLQGEQLLQPRTGKAEEGIELLTREGLLFCRSLQLDEPAIERSHAIHVSLGRRVLEIAEVEARLSRDDAR